MLVDYPRERRRCGCGTQLARDNQGEQCAACQRAGDEGALLGPPAVPDEFWEYPAMRDSLARRHMGCVIRAFREHPLHGRNSMSQSTVAGWIGITQAQVSRIENGAAIVDLGRLIAWALLLRIPEEYLWFDLPGRDNSVGRGRFLQLGGLAVAGTAGSALFRTQPVNSLTERDCAQWLAWELWQHGEQALHFTELPLSIARYLELVDDSGHPASNLNKISPDGNILCDPDGYCSPAHPSLIEFYVAQRLFTDIALGGNKLLATTQTTHSIDLVLQSFVRRLEHSANLLNGWMSTGTSAVLRVNSAGILAKLGKPNVEDKVVAKLKTDRDSRHLYLTAVSSRVLALEWNQAAKFAETVEHATPETRCDLTAAQLSKLAHELTNPRDGGARWCSAILLGHFHDSGPEVVRPALHHALQTEPTCENLRIIGTVLAGNNPLK